ncbi:phenylacetate-CoA oxygenase subunit PaaJ [Paracoccaceae bacterium]|nr:phenylacetate-CoA oxygenase subunit PaaJ [Paracoccaceae bacterium]
MDKSTEEAWGALKELTDPELPFLTLDDLGVIREIKRSDKNHVVTIAPTYIGCPAISVIEEKISSELKKLGITAIIEKSFSPPWSSDWISENGRKKMEEFGISPPHPKDTKSFSRSSAKAVKCPQCTSYKTEKVSEFGSTACKSLYRCLDCQEPFDHFKCV